MDIRVHPHQHAMTAIHIDFTWYRDTKGYRLRRDRLVPNGGDRQFYRPLEDFPTLFKIFTAKCRSKKGVVDFVNKFGPLITNPGDLISTRVLGLPAFMAAGGDSIREIVQQAKWMAKLLSDHKSDIPQLPLVSLEAFLVTSGAE